MTGVVRRNTVAQFQEATQPSLVLAAEVLDADPALEAAQHCAQRDHHDVLEVVQVVAGLPPRVGQLGEVDLGVGKNVPSIYPASAIAQPQLRRIPKLHSAIALALYAG